MITAIEESVQPREGTTLRGEARRPLPPFSMSKRKGASRRRWLRSRLALGVNRVDDQSGHSALDCVAALLESRGSGLLVKGRALLHLDGGGLLTEVNVNVGHTWHAGKDRTDPSRAAGASCHTADAEGILDELARALATLLALLTSTALASDLLLYGLADELEARHAKSKTHNGLCRGCFTQLLT